MFEVFGKFESIEALNMTAEGLKTEGDKASLFKLAEENGIEKEDAKDYLDGMDTFATASMAALGRIKIEAAALKPCEIMEDWIEYIKAQILENPDMREKVLKKDLSGCIAALMKWSFDHQYTISQDIVKAAGINASKVTLGIPGGRRCKEIIRQYYMEG